SDMRSIEMSPAKVTLVRATSPGASGLHEAYAARLLVAERPHLGGEALLGMRAATKVLATAFWELQLARPPWEDLLLLWVNSTYGVLSFLSCATSSMGDIFKMKKEQLIDMPVCAPSAFEAEACAAMLAALGRAEFLPFPGEFARAAAQAGPRYALD